MVGKTNASNQTSATAVMFHNYTGATVYVSIVSKPEWGIQSPSTFSIPTSSEYNISMSPVTIADIIDATLITCNTAVTIYYELSLSTLTIWLDQEEARTFHVLNQDGNILEAGHAGDFIKLTLQSTSYSDILVKDTEGKDIPFFTTGWYSPIALSEKIEIEPPTMNAEIEFVLTCSNATVVVVRETA